MHVEIWADVVCPWSYIGKRRFEAALRQFEHREVVSVTWRSFELDPDAPTGGGGGQAEHMAALAGRYGIDEAEARLIESRVSALAAEERLRYNPERPAPINSFNAHRLVHLAASHGRQEEAVEALFHAYFIEGLSIADRDVLAKVGERVGVSAYETDDMLSSRALSLHVAEDQRIGVHHGLTGVPFFVLNRVVSVSGAQPVDTLVAMLRRGWDDEEASSKLAADL